MNRKLTNGLAFAMPQEILEQAARNAAYDALEARVRLSTARGKRVDTTEISELRAKANSTGRLARTLARAISDGSR
jgi:hypothetical protein